MLGWFIYNELHTKEKKKTPQPNPKKSKLKQPPTAQRPALAMDRLLHKASRSGWSQAGLLQEHIGVDFRMQWRSAARKTDAAGCCDMGGKLSPALYHLHDRQPPPADRLGSNRACWLFTSAASQTETGVSIVLFLASWRGETQQRALPQRLTNR